jgi:signal transduction histidine kinase
MENTYEPSSLSNLERRRVHSVPDDRPCVLVVDDVADNLLAFEAVLRRDDLAVVTASSGRAALEILLQRSVAVAIIDVQMPEMDGIELAEMMRGVERTRHVPIIFITAGIGDRGRMFRGYEAGAVDFLFKPVDDHVLRSKVDVLVALDLQRRQLVLTAEHAEAARREAERSRAEREATLVELARSISLNEMFMGILSHDLRNPLATIAMGVNVLLERGVLPSQRDVIELISSSTSRMTRMVAQLLDVTRSRLAGGIAIEHGPCDLVQIVRGIIAEAEVAHPDRDFDLVGVGELLGQWDADRLEQVVSNLLANAVLHGSPDRPVTVSVGVDGGEAVLRVHNWGTAIPVTVLPTIFEPYIRGGNRELRTTGLGLGLFITSQIVCAHQGRIDVRSTADLGTEFTVTLPLTRLRTDQLDHADGS